MCRTNGGQVSLIDRSSWANNGAHCFKAQLSRTRAPPFVRTLPALPHFKISITNNHIKNYRVIARFNQWRRVISPAGWARCGKLTSEEGGAIGVPTLSKPRGMTQAKEMVLYRVVSPDIAQAYELTIGRRFLQFSILQTACNFFLLKTAALSAEW